MPEVYSCADFIILKLNLELDAYSYFSYLSKLKPNPLKNFLSFHTIAVTKNSNDLICTLLRFLKPMASNLQPDKSIF
jgi:hypothetical protein